MQPRQAGEKRRGEEGQDRAQKAEEKKIKSAMGKEKDTRKRKRTDYYRLYREKKLLEGDKYRKRKPIAYDYKSFAKQAKRELAWEKARATASTAPSSSADSIQALSHFLVPPTSLSAASRPPRTTRGASQSHTHLAEEWEDDAGSRGDSDLGGGGDGDVGKGDGDLGGGDGDLGEEDSEEDDDDEMQESFAA